MRDKTRIESHVHEFVGSVKFTDINGEIHNHRFAGMTMASIPLPSGGHFHKLQTSTDNYKDHIHLITEISGPAIEVCEGRHVHFLQGETKIAQEHMHEFKFATCIEDPSGE